MNINELFGTSDTNEQIAYILTKQTYDERLAMAQWICDALEPSPDYYVLCNILGAWAEEETVEESNVED